jgi:hypothetical protein
MSDDGRFALPPERRPAFTKMESAAINLAPFLPFIQKDCIDLCSSFKLDSSEGKYSCCPGVADDAHQWNELLY